MRDSIKTENELTTNIDRLIFKKIPTKKINDTETDFQLTVNPEPEKYMYPEFAKAETDYLVQEFKRYTIHNIEIKRTAEAILVNYFKPVEFEQLLNHSFDNIKKSNPYLSRTDFINDYLGQTLFYLELILSDLNDPNNDGFYPFSTDFFEINKPSTYFIFIVHKYPLDYNSESLFYYFKKIKSIIQGTAYFETIIQKEKTPNEPKKQFEFENNTDFVKLSTETIYTYFNTELVDKNYLKTENLHSYLKQAFEQTEQPKTKLKLMGCDSKTIQAIFYTFYNDTCKSPHGKKTNFLKLLTNYFEDFEHDKIYTNWAKSKYKD